MEAKQLRIGNWVYSQEIGENVQISSINDEYVTFKDYVTWDCPNYDEINPIPLTEDILLKCGFVNDLFLTQYYEIRLKGYTLKLIVMDGKIMFRGYGTSITIIKHLHQLQNLFYSLTGEELKINL